MLLKRRISIVVAAFVVGGAVLAWRMTKTPRTGPVENPFAPTPIEVRFRDRKVGEVVAAKGEATFFARRSEDMYEVTDDVHLFVPTPCGVQRLKDVYVFPENGDRFRVDVSHSYWVASVDNRGGPARRLRIGELDVPVDADRVVRRELFVAPCGEMRVRLDDEDLGRVKPEGYGFLVDPTGKRCYRMRDVKYGGSLLFPFAAPPEPKVAIFRAKKLHPMAGIVEHLLERAPDKVETYTMRGMMPSAERREILECDADADPD
jgi:hypothetical protein